ncbi:baseplate J/gp47 family protein [Kovacikia minuta CCNUW1]|uniref:baseplate J/gp47 family protein n=1 Tax=Kovacikia minuta TaxID=2931930 RepID=UPI001CCFA3CC|nr:baseplate J/gp47 family protein [Kovacikia minuta]UBF27080.1 baseplate J/gp47 family protein [Kovacikia minuta CCNUW1]
MIDPGSPFSVAYADLIQSLEDSIRNGVEQPDRFQFFFRGAVSAYELPRLVYAITQVSGLMQSAATVFRAGQDYGFSNNRIVWLEGAQRPDEGSRVLVEYTYRERPAGLTDFNPGSVTGTLIRAVARELKLLYEQTNEAYRRAFIDTASGVALDNVVALLGIDRNPALKATGQVTFFRKTATKTTVTIPAGTRIADQGDRIFLTLADATIPAEIPGELQEQSAGLIQLNNRIAELVGIWQQTDAQTPENRLATQDTAAGKPFGEDERTITLADGVRPPGKLLIHYKPKSVTIAVEALEPGPTGNVNSGTVVVMPTPPRGIDGVINAAAISGGQVAESDEQLRERAKFALERAGNATLNAIKFAVLEVDGVEGVEVMDHSLDPTIPLGEVRVRYSGGGDSEFRRQEIERSVKQVVEQTRAAGIFARVDAINTIAIAGTFYLIPATPISSSTREPVRLAMQQFLQQTIAALKTLAIGEPLSIRRLNAFAFNIPALADTAEAQLSTIRSGTSQTVPDPFLISDAELIRPDNANLKTTILNELKANSPTNNQIVISLTALEELSLPQETTVEFRELNQDVNFRNFSIAIAIILKAKLRNAPTQPEEQIASFTRTLQFSNSTTQILTIQRVDIPLSDTRLAEYMINPANAGDEPAKATLTAAAYPGLQAVKDLPVSLSF